MAKKRLTVAKTFKKIDNLRKLKEEIKQQMSAIGSTVVRGKSVSQMDNNYILYNIATFKTMLKEAADMFPEGDKRASLIADTVGEDVELQLQTMREYLRLRIKDQDVVDRLDKLENYLDNIPSEEKKAYRLEQAAEKVDERDLVEDNN